MYISNPANDRESAYKVASLNQRCITCRSNGRRPLTSTSPLSNTVSASLPTEETSRHQPQRSTVQHRDRLHEEGGAPVMSEKLTDMEEVNAVAVCNTVSRLLV